MLSQKKNILGIFISFFIIISCNPKKASFEEGTADKGKPITIAVEKGSKFLLFNHKVAKIGIIRLDSTKLVAEISKTLTIDSNLFILDKKSDTFFCFNQDGSINWSYNKLGKGPEEHDKLLDFTVRNNYVYLYDKQFKLIKLDFKGKFISEKRLILNNLDFFPDLIFVDSASNYITYNDDMADKKEISHKIVILDSNISKIKKVYLKKTNPEGNKRWVNSEYPMQVFINNKGVFYTEALNDTIYSYSNGNLKRKYILDFGDYKTPESFKKIKSVKLEDFWKSNYGGNISSVFETDSLLTFKTLISGHPVYHLFNKKTHQIKSYKGFLLDGNPFYAIAEFIGGFQNKLYFLIEPDNVLNAYKHFKQQDYKSYTLNNYDKLIKQKSPIFKDLLKGLNLYSNQIIITVEFESQKIFSND